MCDAMSGIGVGEGSEKAGGVAKDKAECAKARRIFCAGTGGCGANGGWGEFWIASFGTRVGG